MTCCLIEPKAGWEEKQLRSVWLHGAAPTCKASQCPRDGQGQHPQKQDGSQHPLPVSHSFIHLQILTNHLLGLGYCGYSKNRRESTHGALSLVEGDRHLIIITYQGIVARLFKYNNGIVVMVMFY